MLNGSMMMVGCVYVFQIAAQALLSDAIERHGQKDTERELRL